MEEAQVTQEAQATSKGGSLGNQDEIDRSAELERQKSQDKVHKSGRPVGAPQILEGAVVGSLPDEIRLTPETARHFLKFLLPMEKEAFLFFHPLADIPGSPQNLMNLSTLDYSNYSANTKSVHVEDIVV
jgi:hypothetical protein